jgi:hypothetical protein
MGSEFVVRLPVLDAVQDAPPTPQRPQPTTAGLKVLLVEDSQDAAEMMAGALEMLGCHVAVAHDGPAPWRPSQRIAPMSGCWILAFLG